MLSAGEESIIVQISILVGIVALAMAALFVVVALALRGFVSRGRRRRRDLEERWMPLMLRALREPVRDFPRLRRRERAAVLAVWNRLMGSLSGQGARRLQAFARNAGLSDVAHRLVRRGRPAERLAATVFLGHQQDLRAVRALRGLARRPEPIVRAEAARALVRLDPAAGARAVTPILVDWPDCHPATAVAILRDAPGDEIARAVGDHLFSTDDTTRQARLLEILGTVGTPRSATVARQMLRRTVNPELIARCLEILRERHDPDDAVLVRRFLNHPASFVRLHAVAVLARLQVPGDGWRILAKIDDPDWWVRHRAAEAVVRSSRFDRRFIELVARVHPDRYARGALQHVLTEQGT